MVLASRRGADDQRVRPRQRQPARRLLGIGGFGEPGRDPAWDHRDPLRRDAQGRRDLPAGELRDGDDRAGASCDRRQQQALVADVGRRVRLGRHQRRHIVDHDDIAAVKDGSEIGRRVDEQGTVRSSGQHELLPEMPRPVREARPRRDHAVAIRAARRQRSGEFPCVSLDAADLRTDGCPGVDGDGRARQPVSYGRRCGERRRRDDG